MVSITPNILQQLSRMDSFPDRTKGILVTSVFSKSPAERSGILEGDVVYKINGNPVSKTYDFLKRLGVCLIALIVSTAHYWGGRIGYRKKGTAGRRRSWPHYQL